jgi:hypothetical protein
MIVNFKVRKISWVMRKLVRTPTLIKKKWNKYNSEIKNLNGFCIVHIIHNYLIERTFLM